MVVFGGHPLVSNSRACRFMAVQQARCNVSVASDKSSCLVKHRAQILSQSSSVPSSSLGFKLKARNCCLAGQGEKCAVMLSLG